MTCAWACSASECNACRRHCSTPGKCPSKQAEESPARAATSATLECPYPCSRVSSIVAANRRSRSKRSRREPGECAASEACETMLPGVAKASAHSLTTYDPASPSQVSSIQRKEPAGAGPKRHALLPSILPQKQRTKVHVHSYHAWLVLSMTVGIRAIRRRAAVERRAPQPTTTPTRSTTDPSRHRGTTAQRATLCDMRVVTHREMRNQSGEILRHVADGETIQVTNNGQVAALIVPPGTDSLADLASRGQVRVARNPTSNLRSIVRRKSTIDSQAIVADIPARWGRSATWIP